MSTIFNIRNLRLQGVSRASVTIGTLVVILALVAAIGGAQPAVGGRAHLSSFAAKGARPVEVSRGFGHTHVSANTREIFRVI